MKTLIGIIILLFLSMLIIGACSELTINNINNCKVIKLHEQQNIKSNDTEFRYLVITDKETFICKSSILNGKFNNSDLFWKLKEDSVYNFKVSGWGKTFFTDYKNILEIYE